MTCDVNGVELKKGDWIKLPNRTDDLRHLRYKLLEVYPDNRAFVFCPATGTAYTMTFIDWKEKVTDDGELFLLELEKGSLMYENR